MKNLSSFIITFLLLSCNPKEPTPHSIPIDPYHASASIADVFESYYAVALETTEDNLIRSIDKIEIANDKFYILDKRKYTVYIFNKDGTYMSKLNRRGEGPNEYLDITDFTLIDSKLYILSRAGRKLMIYSESGDVLKHYKLDDWFDYMHVEGKNIFLYSNYSNNKLQNIIVAEISDETISYNKEFLPFLKNQSFSFSTSPFNTAANGELLVCQQYDYNVYHLTKDSIKVLYHLDFYTKDKIPTEFQQIGFDKVYQNLSMKSVVTRINLATIHDGFLYLIFFLDYTKHIAKVNTSTFTAEVAKMEYNDDYPFVFSQPIVFNGDYLVSHLDASAVLQFDAYFKSNSGEALADEDNPVLFFHKLK